MEATTSMISLGILPLLVIVLVAIAAMLGLIVLLVNPKTRVFGIVLLLVPIVLVALAVPWFYARVSLGERAAAEMAEMELMQRRQAIARSEMEARRDRQIEVHNSASTQGTPAADKPLAEAPEKPAGSDAKAPKKPAASDAKPPEKPAGPGAKASARTGAAVQRPSWLGSPSQRVEGAFRMVVTTDPYVTATECQARLPEAFNAAVADYIQNVYLAHQPARVSARIGLPLDFIREHVVQEEFTEPLDSSVGPMVRVHAMLEFDREVNARIDDEWNKLVVGRRLSMTVAGLGLVLLLLSVVWGYLRIDVATAGAYRGRLRVLAVLGFLAVLVVGLAFVA